jgi:tetratricopeptide (TPR) repeat protein
MTTTRVFTAIFLLLVVTLAPAGAGAAAWEEFAAEASVAQEEGDFDTAVAFYERALRAVEESRGANHPEVSTVLVNMSGLLHMIGRFDEAEANLTRAIAIDKKALGERHTEVGADYNVLAQLYADLGRYDEAEKLYLEALSIWTDKLGANHQNIAGIAVNLGELYREQTRFDEAEKMLLAIRKSPSTSTISVGCIANRAATIKPKPSICARFPFA